MTEGLPEITFCQECYMPFEKDQHWLCPYCGVPTLLRLRMDRRNEKKRAMRREAKGLKA